MTRRWAAELAQLMRTRRRRGRSREATRLAPALSRSLRPHGRRVALRHCPTSADRTSRFRWPLVRRRLSGSVRGTVGRLTGSAEESSCSTGELFDEVGGGGDAFGGLGHPGGEFAGPAQILRGQNGSEVAIRDFSLVAEKRRPVPTFNRLTRAPQTPGRAASRGSRGGVRRAGPHSWFRPRRGARRRGKRGGAAA